MTLTEDEKQSFKAAYLSSAAMQTLCKQFSLSERQVNEIAYDLGLLEKLQFRWNEEKEAELVRLIKYGHSLGDIAKQLECTKETVRRKKFELFPVKNYWAQPGKVTRLNLSFKKATGPRERVLKRTRLPRKVAARKFNYPENPIKTIESENARRSKVFELQVGQEYVSLIDHKDSQCRCVKEKNGKFIGFCAKQAEPGSSYCKEHGEMFNQINPFGKSKLSTAVAMNMNAAKDNGRAYARRGFELMHIKGLTTQGVAEVFGLKESEVVRIFDGYPEERQAVLMKKKEGRAA